MEQNGHHAVSVKEAATLLGISPRGVRQRITRGTLKGTLLAGEWMVYLGEQVEHVPRSPEQKEKVQPLREQAVQNVQFQAVMDTWIAPLTKTIAEQAEEIGRLKAELEHERNEKQEIVKLLQEEEHISQESPRGFWARLFGT